MITTRGYALNGIGPVEWLALSMDRFGMDRSLSASFARGQNNTFEHAIRIPDIYSAVESAIWYALYTRDITVGLQDLVDRVRALILDARNRLRILRSPKYVRVDGTRSSDE